MEGFDKENNGAGYEEPASEPEQLVEPPALMAIEEHRKREKVSPSIFAAVMQAQGWASGKKTTEAVFKNAVNAFLGAPIGR